MHTKLEERLNLDPPVHRLKMFKKCPYYMRIKAYNNLSECIAGIADSDINDFSFLVKNVFFFLKGHFFLVNEYLDG